MARNATLGAAQTRRAAGGGPAAAAGERGVATAPPLMGIDFIDRSQGDPIQLRRPDDAAVAREGASAVPASVYEALRRPGEPLASSVSAEATRRLGRDFGGVRIHQDAVSTRDIGARAYNVGPHIVFGEGRYAPHTPAGRADLDHELGHFMQRADSSPAARLQLGARGSAHEQQADRLMSATSAVAAQGLLSASPRLPVDVVARLPDGPDGGAAAPTDEAVAVAPAPAVDLAPSSQASAPEGGAAPALQRKIEARLTALEALANDTAEGEESVAVHHTLALGLREIRGDLTLLEVAAVSATPEQARAIHTALGTLYERAARVAPFYTQNANANILSTSKTAAMRTCNVTVVGMILEALGKTPADYRAGKSPDSRLVLDAIAADFKAEGKIRTTNFEELRMPDFMQIVFVHRTLTDAVRLQKPTKKMPVVPPGTLDPKSGLGLAEASLIALAQSKDAGDRKELDADIERARVQGARRIVYSDHFDPFFAAFGAEVETHASFDETLKDKLDSVVEKAGAVGAFRDIITARAKSAKLERSIAELEEKRARRQPARDELAEQLKLAQAGLTAASEEPRATDKRAAREQKADLSRRARAVKGSERELAKLDKTLGNIDTKELPALTRRFDAQQETIADKEALLLGTSRKIQGKGLISLADYKAQVLPPLKAALSRGKQVLVNLHNHFVRLVAIDANRVTVDDPARDTSNKVDVTWDQALAQGYFKNYIVVR